MISATISEPAILLSINERYRHGMSGYDLYDATRGVWKANGERLLQVKLALAIFQQQIVGVIQPERWHPAGTTVYVSGREIDPTKYCDRWEFTGSEAPPETWAKYVGSKVSRSWDNPIGYRNV